MTGSGQGLPTAASLQNFDTAVEIDAAIQLLHETTGAEYFGDLLSGILADDNQGSADYVNKKVLQAQLESMILEPASALKLAEDFAAAGVRDIQRIWTMSSHPPSNRRMLVTVPPCCNISWIKYIQ